jgi:hypothetical protein
MYAHPTPSQRDVTIQNGIDDFPMRVINLLSNVAGRCASLRTRFLEPFGGDSGENGHEELQGLITAEFGDYHVKVVSGLGEANR